MDELKYGDLIKVDSAEEKYVYINGCRCKCGGHFIPLLQRLLNAEGVPVDVIDTQCEACGAQRQFGFDSSFDKPLCDLMQVFEKSNVKGWIAAVPLHGPMDRKGARGT